MKGICKRCGKLGGVYIPSGGDGSLWLMRRHKSVIDGTPCVQQEMDEFVEESTLSGWAKNIRGTD